MSGVTEDVCSNVDIRSEGRMGDLEEKKRESTKELGNDQPSSIYMNHSQSSFKMEVKVDIKPYQGEINSLKLKKWLE